MSVKEDEYIAVCKRIIICFWINFGLLLKELDVKKNERFVI